MAKLLRCIYILVSTVLTSLAQNTLGGGLPCATQSNLAMPLRPTRAAEGRTVNTGSAAHSNISTQYSRYLAIAAIQPITDKRCYSARARLCLLVRDGVVICLIAAISFLLLIKAWVMLPLIVIQ